MDLPPPVHQSSHTIINDTIQKAATDVQTISMKQAAAQEYQNAENRENDENRHIDVSSDGTWMTRGHTSNVGLTTTIGMYSGKVIDTQCKSKKCKSCQYWEK
jgi:hypothetical protein